MTWVINGLKPPTDSTESEKYALQAPGKKYNSFGAILALIASQDPGNKTLGWLGEEVATGQAPNLLTLGVRGGLDSGAPMIQRGYMRPAKPAKCCDSVDDIKKCIEQAKTRCFDGKGSFQLDPTASGGETLHGQTDSAGGFHLGPGKVNFMLGSTKGAAIGLQLVSARIRGTIKATGELDGVITGGIPKAYLDQVFIPWIAHGLNDVYNDTKTDQKTRDLLRTLFDWNRDYTISTQEVRDNGLIKTFLGGDVDLDCDGSKELSFGSAFNAVPAKVSP